MSDTLLVYVYTLSYIRNLRKDKFAFCYMFFVLARNITDCNGTCRVTDTYPTMTMAHLRSIQIARAFRGASVVERADGSFVLIFDIGGDSVCLAAARQTTHPRPFRTIEATKKPMLELGIGHARIDWYRG